MTVFARLEVTPTTDGSMSDEIAKAVEALDDYDVRYETTPMDTEIEGDTAEEVFSAALAAHQAVSTDRVITSLELDDQRTRDQHSTDRVDAIENALGRPPKSTAE